MFAAASAIRGNQEVTGGSGLIRILKWRSSQRRRVTGSLKSAVSHGEDYILRKKKGSQG